MERSPMLASKKDLDLENKGLIRCDPENKGLTMLILKTNDLVASQLESGQRKPFPSGKKKA
jgi:hypothetical protein